MVFYDPTQLRKFAFRLLIIVVISFFLATAVIITISITNTGHLTTPQADLSYYQNAIGDDKKIALTFDDGPNNITTPQIVSILQKYNAPATFFVTGQSALKYSQVLRQLHQQGFEIGNHTFTHSPHVHDSLWRLRLEINTTKTIIKTITGQSTTLYRPPFLLDIGDDATLDPIDHSHPITWVAATGHTPIGADIDPRDWQNKSAADIINASLAQAQTGHIILLHDSGQNTSATIQALPTIIETLAAQGYQFVSLRELLALPPTPTSPPTTIAEAVYVYLTILFSQSLNISIIIALSLVFGKLIILLLLHLYAQNRRHQPPASTWSGSVSVVIPAFNEAANIASTITSVFASTHQPQQVIVVNDGSTDQTAHIVTQLQKTYGHRLTLINTDNHGKAHALNLGFLAAFGDIIITLDADTIFTPRAVNALIQPFADPSISAVAGKVKVIKNSKLINKFQELEYTVSQNIEKFSLSVVNAISVVPGSIGAWRASDLRACGNISSDTLVEDQDLTLNLLAHDRKIIYQPQALAFTEVPNTNRDFIKQRFRWIFGTLQCLWKYKFIYAKPRLFNLKFIIFPNNILFNLIVPILYPLVDIAALLSILSGTGFHLIFALAAFTLADFLYALTAVAMEPNNFRQIWVLPLQRLYYRYVMYAITIMALIKAIEGTRSLWARVEKNGYAQKYYFDHLASDAPVKL